MPKRIEILLLLVSWAVAAQTPPPATDVFLAPFKGERGSVTIGTPVNISKNAGYDNQPSFTPDGSAVLFTSVRGNRKPDPSNTAASGSDIYRYDISSGRLTQLTDTPESEYSPTTTPDGQHFSVVRVEADGTQRLWRFTMDGQKPELVLPDIKPVGYHAWIDDNTLALFVLGEPATLQLANVNTGTADVAAKPIGRSIARIPGGGISYVQRETREDTQSWTVMELTPSTRQTAALVPAPAGTGQPDVAWTPDGMLLMASGGKLYGWRRGQPQTQMQVVAELDTLGLRGISRLAVSPRGDRLALVAQE